MSGDVLSSDGAADTGSLLDSEPTIVPSPEPVSVPKKNIPTSIYRSLGLALVVLGLIIGAFLLLHNLSANKKQTSLSAQLSDANASIKPQALQLPSIGQQLNSSNATLPNSLIINGKVSVNNSLVLSPTEKPNNPVAGQMYYDQNNNQLSYYNGSNFVDLQASAASSSVVNNNITNVTNNITNVTNNNGGGAPVGTLTSSTGTAGDVAMFLTDNTLGDSLINENGTTVTVGGSNLLIGDSVSAANVTLGSPNGSSATLIQGGLGNLALNTGNTTGTSGSVTLESGSSSTTSSGNVSVDTGTSFIPGIVTGDVTFEDDTNDNFDSWFCDTVTPTNTQAHSGNYSLAVTESAGCGNWGIIQNGNQSTFAVTAGHHILFSVWIKAATTPRTINGGLDWIGGSSPATSLTPTADTTTGWTELTTTATVPAGATEFTADFDAVGAPGETHYFDDIEVTDLSSSSTTAALNLGTSNAQIVNVGNLNELDATTINGGSGIDLNAGSASLNAVAGSIDLSGQAASSLETTAGALTLEGGGGSDSGVVVRPANDSTTAFQVQDANATPFLTADTANNVFTSNGNVIAKSASGCDYNNYVAAVLSLGPSAYWKLEDGGGTAADSSGNGDIGTLSNVTTGVTPGPFSCDNTHPAMSFDGTAPSGITTATQAPMPNSFTQVVMFKSNGFGLLIGSSDSGFGNYDRELYIGNGGELYFRIYSQTSGNDIINSPASVNDNNWHLAIATVSNAGMYLYVDGVLVASNPTYNTPQPYTGSWYLGDNNGNFGDFTGDMAEVAVLPFALNQTQATNLARNSGFYNYNTASIGIGTATPGANLEDAGSALFDAPVDSTTAFQIQNSAQQNLFAVDTQNNAIVLGNDGTPASLTVRGGQGIGNNVAGSNLTIDGSNGTGSANGGDIIFDTGQSPQGGIEFDNAGQIYSSGTSISMSFTVGTQSDRLMLVTTDWPATSVTYDGRQLAPLTSVTSSQHHAQGIFEEMWYLLNPPSGSFTLASTSTSGGVQMGVASYYNVDQSNPLGTPVTATSDISGSGTTSMLVPTSTTSQAVVDAFGTDLDSTVDGCTPTNGGQTVRWSIVQQYQPVQCGSDVAANGGTVSIGWDATNSDWADIGVVLNPAVAGSTPLQLTGGTTPDTLNDRLHITSTGNIGIDNSNPQYSLDVAGSAHFQNTSNSTSAFQVQDSGGDTLLNVDTSNEIVSVGTSGSDTVDVGGLSGTIGYTSIGSAQDTGDLNLISGGQYTAPTTGNIGSISAFIGSNVDNAPNNRFQMALYADNGSNAPGNYIASTAVATITPDSWNTLPISASVTAGTKYWVVRWSNTSNTNDDATVHDIVTGQSHYYAYTSGVTFGSGPDNGMPATFPTPSSDNNTSSFESIYASYTTTTGPALTIGTSGDLTDYGSALFSDTTSSTAAFQIQNNIGVALFSADTSRAVITVSGTATSFGTLSLSNSHFSSTQTTPPTISVPNNCGTSPSAQVAVGSTDTAGSFTITTGTGGTSSTCDVTITFQDPYSTNPKSIIVVGNTNTASVARQIYVSSSSANNFDASFSVSAGGANSTTYSFNYWVVQ